MSRGPGKIELAIEAAFTAMPDVTFSVEELAAFAYPGINRVEKRHRVAILRAADKVAARMWWIGRAAERPGHSIIYSSLLNVRSYALGRMRRDFSEGALPLDRLHKLLEEPNSDDRYARREAWERIQPGGAYWYHVEINRAQKAGDAAEVARLTDELNDAIGAKVRAHRTKWGGSAPISNEL